MSAELTTMPSALTIVRAADQRVPSKEANLMLAALDGGRSTQIM
jgi:hypothetical protein